MRNVGRARAQGENRPDMEQTDLVGLAISGQMPGRCVLLSPCPDRGGGGPWQGDRGVGTGRCGKLAGRSVTLSKPRPSAGTDCARHVWPELRIMMRKPQQGQRDLGHEAASRVLIPRVTTHGGGPGARTMRTPGPCISVTGPHPAILDPTLSGLLGVSPVFLLLAGVPCPVAP